MRLHVVVLEDGEDVALLDLRPLLDEHPLDPARDLGADHRLVARLEITLGAEQLLGLAGGHRLDQADRHLGLGADLVVLPVAEDAPPPPRRPSGISQISDREEADPAVAGRAAPPRPRPVVAGAAPVDLQRGEVVAQASPPWITSMLDRPIDRVTGAGDLCRG